AKSRESKVFCKGCGRGFTTKLSQNLASHDDRSGNSVSREKRYNRTEPKWNWRPFYDKETSYVVARCGSANNMPQETSIAFSKQRPRFGFANSLVSRQHVVKPFPPGFCEMRKRLMHTS